MPNNAAIIATDINNVVAIGGRQPWNCPDYDTYYNSFISDFDYIIMGSETYFYLCAFNKLPSYPIIVLTRTQHKYNKIYDNVIFMGLERLKPVLESNAYCVVIGGPTTILNLLDYIDNVIVAYIKGKANYDIGCLLDSATYLTHNFKKGQRVDGDFHVPNKNKFDVSPVEDHGTFSIHTFDRKLPNFKVALAVNDLDLNDPRVKDRRCLHCGAEFLSSWVGNRICGFCKVSEHFKINQDQGPDFDINLNIER